MNFSAEKEKSFTLSKSRQRKTSQKHITYTNKYKTKYQKNIEKFSVWQLIFTREGSSPFIRDFFAFSKNNGVDFGGNCSRNKNCSKFRNETCLFCHFCCLVAY